MTEIIAKILFIQVFSPHVLQFCLFAVMELIRTMSHVYWVFLFFLLQGGN